MKFDAFGKLIEVCRCDDRWQVFYLGEGKKRLARDINIPPEIPKNELSVFIADLLHEYATIDNNEVTIIKDE